MSYDAAGSNTAIAGEEPRRRNRPKVSLLARALLVCDRLLPSRPFGCRSMAACPSSQTGPGDMCRIPVPPKAEHAGDLSSYPTTVYLPDGDDYCSGSRLAVDDLDVDSRQLSRSVPVSSGGADTSWTTRPSLCLVPSEDRQKWVNPPPNKNPFTNCPTSRSRQRLPTHTGVSGMQRPAAPVSVRHDSWSHSASPSTSAGDHHHHHHPAVARTLPDWRPENLPTLAARSPPSRHGHTCARTPATQSADCQERCSVADCVYCSSAAPDRR